MKPLIHLAGIIDRLKAAGTEFNPIRDPNASVIWAEFANRRQNLVNRDRIMLQDCDGELHTHLTLTDLTEDQLAQICAIIR